jgi:hypothetical protein
LELLNCCGPWGCAGAALRSSRSRTSDYKRCQLSEIQIGLGALIPFEYNAFIIIFHVRQVLNLGVKMQRDLLSIISRRRRARTLLAGLLVAICRLAAKKLLFISLCARRPLSLFSFVKIPRRQPFRDVNQTPHFH